MAGHARKRASRGTKSGRSKIERIDAAERIEIDSHRAAQRAVVSRDAAGKDGALEGVERKVRHLLGDIDDFAVTRPPSRHQGVDQLRHSGRETPHVPDREDRRHGAPLQLPLRLLRREQAIAQDREHSLLKTVLGIIGRIVGEHPADRGRMACHDNFAERQGGGRQ